MREIAVGLRFLEERPEGVAVVAGEWLGGWAAGLVGGWLAGLLGWPAGLAGWWAGWLDGWLFDNGVVPLRQIAIALVPGGLERVK